MLDVKSLLEGPIHRMSHVFRYSSLPTTRKENVAEHSYYVVLYSLLIARDIEARELAKIDYGKLLARACVHDLDESLTGDFLRVVKYGHPDLKRALDEVSVSMIRKMEEGLKVQVLDLWESAKADDIEGQIVEVVDLARVVSYAIEEVRAGNQHLAPVLREVYQYFCKLRDKLGASPVWDYANLITEYCGDLVKEHALA